MTTKRLFLAIAGLLLAGVVTEAQAGLSFVRSFGSSGSGDGQLNGPADVAVDSFGNVWVADTFNNRVEEFSSTGTFLQSFGSLGTGNGQFNEPNGVAVDSSGNVWVVDRENNRVEEFSQTAAPEPAPTVLIGSLLACVVGCRCLRALLKRAASPA